MWPRTDLIDLLGIDHPILQAPMGGESTPAMAIAVCNAGGLGGLGCSFMSDAELRENVGATRAGTNRPFNLNFFAHPEPRESPEIDARIREMVEPFFEELGLGTVPDRGEPPCETFNESRLAAVLDLTPKVVSFHFGLPPAEMVRSLKDAGSVILSTATTVTEARWLADAGADAIIAQGWEAGGHRGTFEVSLEDFGIGTMALVPQIADAVNVPVIAAGGIADGRGIAAAFVLGASGVQLGTAFLSCPEANISDGYRNALRNARDDETRLTRAFSGRPARAKNNRYMEAISKRRVDFPDFPTMNAFSSPLEEACSASDASGFEFFIYGQAAPLNRAIPAGDLVSRLVKETQVALGG
jgi:nitronate monooxygenase